MSFGGSVLAMIQSLRANARPKHKAYQNRNKTEELRFQAYKELWTKKVSPEELDTSGCDEAKKLLNAYITDYGEDDSTDLLKEIMAE